MNKEFKGTKGKWGCVFTPNRSRAVRSKCGLICVLTKPFRYSGQDERYDQELEQMRCDQRLIAAAPQLLEALQELLPLAEQTVIHRKAKGTHNLGGVFLDSAIRKANKAIEKAL